MNMPGFNAETSLYRTRTKYLMIGAHGSLQGAGAVVPQMPVCSKCSNFPIGKRVCCDIRVERGPDGTPHISVGACHDQYCGLLVDLGIVHP